MDTDSKTTIPSTKPSTQRGSFGIGLLIMIMVLGVVASVLSRPESYTQHATETNIQSIDKLSDTKDSLLGFVAINSRLPRPAEADGTERAGHCIDASDCTGQTPWNALGTEPASYVVDPALANDVVLCDSGDVAAPATFPAVTGVTLLTVNGADVSIPNKLVCQKLKRARPSSYKNCTCG